MSATTATALHATRTAEAIVILEATLAALRSQPPVAPDDWAAATTPERVLPFARECARLVGVR